MKRKLVLFTVAVTAAMLPWKQVLSTDSTQYWVKVAANDKFQRSVIADTGAAIEIVRDGFVIAYANLEEKNALERLGWVEASGEIGSLRDFPAADAEFHTYAGVKAELDALATRFPGMVEVNSIGKTVQGRDIWSIIISKDVANSSDKPGVLYMGGHHAREHLSVEVPLRFVQWMMNEYSNGNPRVVNLVDNRQIHLIPMVNPDGLEYDIEGGRYHYWRKNRRQNSNGTYGVDLNRNYSVDWGHGGSSSSPSSDVYMGPAPFSEPETAAIKNYVEAHTNISTLLSFHTFSELVLYPWSGRYNPISDARDFAVHKTMAEKMARWNGYTPQQSSDLYIATGEMNDWSYGTHKIISFTFELDPSSGGMGGFYPGAGAINPVLQKNIEPCLYLLEYADNPYRVLDSSPLGATTGASSFR